MSQITDLEYAHPADDLSRSFTATLASGSQATGYEPVRLTNDNPAYPFKVSGTKFRLVWDFLTAKTVQFVYLVHHNFAAGLTNVKFAMGTTNATGNFSATFTIRAYHEDSFPVNEFLDLRATNPSYRYASLELTTDNVVACSLGKIPIISTVRTLAGNLKVDTNEEMESHPLVEHKTDAGVYTVYSYGTRMRWLRGDMIQSATNSDAIRSWNRAAMGRTLPFTLIPHLTDGTNGVDEPWLCRWTKPELPRVYMGNRLQGRYRLDFEEVSRGLKPTPSAV